MPTRKAGGAASGAVLGSKGRALPRATGRLHGPPRRGPTHRSALPEGPGAAGVSGPAGGALALARDPRHPVLGGGAGAAGPPEPAPGGGAAPARRRGSRAAGPADASRRPSP